MGRDRGSPMSRSRLAQKYPSGLLNTILIAYATSIAIAHNLLYAIDGSKVLQSDETLENNLVIDGIVNRPSELYEMTNVPFGTACQINGLIPPVPG